MSTSRLLVWRASLCYTLCMTSDQKPDSSPPVDQPGRVRTMWHPLLVRMLDYTLGSAYSVREEVSVGKMPLRVDVLLIRREEGRLTEAQAAEISALLPLLNWFTLIEFKGPTDVMERGDFAQLAGCALLWHSQEHEPIPHEEVSLVVLAPTASNALRDELRILGLQMSHHEPGIFRVTGLPFDAWVVETDAMAERGQPVLSLVSRVFLNEGKRIMDKLEYTDERLVVYVAQQVHQFRTEEDFALQHADSQYLEQVENDLLTKIMEWAPVEHRLRGLPPEDRLRGLPAEERVRGLAPEERLVGMTDEEIACLRELLERKGNGSAANPRQNHV